jgi:hypothetical protein
MKRGKRLAQISQHLPISFAGKSLFSEIIG